MFRQRLPFHTFGENSVFCKFLAIFFKCLNKEKKIVGLRADNKLVYLFSCVHTKARKEKETEIYFLIENKIEKKATMIGKKCQQQQRM